MELESVTERERRERDYMETKKHATKNQWVNDEIKDTIWKTLEKNENTTIQNLRREQKQFLEEAHSDKSVTLLKKKTREISNNSTYHPKN